MKKGVWIIPIVVILFVTALFVLPRLIRRSNVRINSASLIKTVISNEAASLLNALPLKEFTVQTSDKDKIYMLNVKLGLGYSANNEDLDLELESNKTEIYFLISGILSLKLKEEIDESQERAELKREILETVNSLLTNGRVEKIFYEEFLISRL